jgi:hypothetical protein
LSDIGLSGRGIRIMETAAGQGLPEQSGDHPPAQVEIRYQLYGRDPKNAIIQAPVKV